MDVRTGEIYEVDPEMAKDNPHLTLLGNLPDPNCKKCKGKGTDRNSIVVENGQHKYRPCTCTNPETNG